MNRDLVLKLNHHARVTGEVKRSDGLRLVLNIPIEDHARLCVAMPDLKSTDAETKTRAWQKFMASPISAPYRVAEKI